jgi:hypothetical protein
LPASLFAVIAGKTDVFFAWVALCALHLTTCRSLDTAKVQRKFGRQYCLVAFSAVHVRGNTVFVQARFAIQFCHQVPPSLKFPKNVSLWTCDQLQDYCLGRLYTVHLTVCCNLPTAEVCPQFFLVHVPCVARGLALVLPNLLAGQTLRTPFVCIPLTAHSQGLTSALPYIVPKPSRPHCT